jgi:tetratricopeptide (TPR) repeat protein
VPAGRVQISTEALWRWLARAAWFLPPIMIIALAVPRLASGAAGEAAFPVPIYIVMNYPLPQKTYANAARILGATNSYDGDQTISEAEAAADSGVAPSQTIQLVRGGLMHAPVNARGWTLLADAYLAEKNVRAGAQALSLALTLGPFDYWVAGRRARACAALWNVLGAIDRDACENQARLLWDASDLRPQLIPLVQTQEGVQLLTRAVDNDPQQVRDINRFLSGVRREQESAVSP